MRPAKIEKKAVPKLPSVFWLVVALMSAVILLLLVVHLFFPGYVIWFVMMIASCSIIHRLIMIYRSNKSSKRGRQMSSRGYVKSKKFKPYTPPEVRQIEKIGEKLRQKAKLK